MYAIIETGGKQYRIEEGSQIRVEKLSAEAGTEYTTLKIKSINAGSAAN